MSQGIYWLLTIPQHEFLPYLPPGVTYIKGQLEQGNNTGYVHWQLLVVMDKKCRISAIKSIFGRTVHAELSRSSAADDYVWKEDTAVQGTRFELGQRKLKRNCSKDWESIKDCAKRGALDDVPADIYVRLYGSLKKIATDHLQPAPIEREVNCYWGVTGGGKSHRAWAEAGLDAFPKDPRSKFWDGYRGQQHVVIDEFRGGIDISHILRWLDKYPVIVEIKGSSTVLKATKIWITSNIHPRDWYPDLDEETKGALLRRLNIVHFALAYQ